MHYDLKRHFTLVIFFSLFYLPLNSSIINEPLNKLKIPHHRSFKQNKEFVTPIKYKKITIAEYFTDPLIMYTSLWGCLFLTLPLWESDKNITGWDNDSERGFNKLTDDFIYSSNTNEIVYDTTFYSRLKMEPFASGRIDPMTKVWYSTALGENLTVLRGDMYAKNIIEPAYFTYLGLYMRAKNYHPAIMITELILLSLLYEITIRPFYLDSSFEQLLKNPGVAITLSIIFDEISTFLLSTPYKGLHVLAYFFNPFNALPNSRIHPLLFVNPYEKSVSIEAIIKLD